jgi:hypothetical protein
MTSEKLQARIDSSRYGRTRDTQRLGKLGHGAALQIVTHEYLAGLIVERVEGLIKAG